MEIVGDKNWKEEQGVWWYYIPSKPGWRTRGVLTQCAYCRKFSPKITSRKNKSGNHFCSRQCGSRAIGGHRNKIGKESHCWKGGRNVLASGYVEIFAPEHPFARGGKYVREHRLVMEKMIGRYLERWEEVHHKNGIKSDNRPENLELWTHSHPAGSRLGEGKHCPSCTCIPLAA